MKRNIKLKLLALALMMFGAVLVNRGVAFAETSTFWVSPMNQKVILTPGERYTGTLKVSNPNDATGAVYYSLSTSPYSAVGEDYDTDLSTETNYTRMKDWISFERDSGSVEPNETDIITFYIDVPEDAPAGGQYATILVRNDTSLSEDVGQLNIASIMQISSIIYATVAGDTVETGEILENNIPSFITSTPLSVTSTVKSTANVHANAEYILQVYPLFSDEEVYTNEEDPETGLIMPETTRTKTVSWDKAPMVGIFKVKQTIKFLGEVSESEKIVVICPIWLMFVVIFAVILAIIYLTAKSKGRKKSKR